MKFASIIAVVAAAASAKAFTVSVWANPNYSGTAFATTGTGTHILGFTAKSYKWTSWRDGCCIKFCSGGHETGYRCGSYSNTNVASANQFNKIVTGCGATTLNC